jgi:choice-of-anchor A domain-containing protein
MKATIKLGILLSAFLAALLPAQASTLSTAFGQAADYNVFVFNNFSDTCCDVGGNLAVGGTTNVNGFAVGQSPVVSSGQANYYSYWGVGKLTGNFSLDVGNAYYALGGSASGTNYTVAGGGGNIFLATGSQSVASTCAGGYNCLNFTTAKTSLQSYSTFLAGQTINASTVADAGDGYDIIANHSGTNYASITAAQLAAGAIHITLPAGATLVINIIPDGTGSASTSNHGIFVNGAQYTGDSATIAENIVFNFSGTSLFTNESITGSILAPNATVTGSGQQIDGQLIANNFTGSAEFHDLLFQGTLPPQTSTPEPASFLMLGAGLIVIGTQAKRLKNE